MSERISVATMRRKLLRSLLAGVAAGPLATFAQKKSPKMVRLGLLTGGNQDSVVELQEALLQGLREHGYEEGKNLVVERRYGEGKLERMHELAAELVRNKVDVILTNTDPPTAAAKRATRTIPIVMIGSTDPVATGFVASLARPGGNITGLSVMSPELSGKRLELMREIIPGLSKVAILWNPENRGLLFDYKETETAARALRLQLQSIEISRVEDLDQAYSALRQGGAQAFVVPQGNTIVFVNRSQVGSFALKHKLPTVFGQPQYVDAGGLMSYGPSPLARWRRAATYVDKILRGTKAADLPVEQPTRFELILNLKAAKALGLTVPTIMQQRADEVIE